MRLALHASRTNRLGSLRRISKRVNGKQQLTTVVIPPFNDEPPEHVYIGDELLQTRPFILQTTRCYHR